MSKLIFKRDIEYQLLQAAKETQVVAIQGPRKCGKTTLARNLFKEHHYVNLEDLVFREPALRDPKGFLNK